MITKTRKITAVVGIAVLLSAATLCSYGADTTTTSGGPSAWIGRAQATHTAWQNTALMNGGGITPATTQPETHAIRHQLLIATFDELFKQLTNVADLLKAAIQASRLSTTTS
jgi:hypothetical protein